MDLDELISSYGLVEELNQNNDYLKGSIELAQEVAGSSVCYVSILNTNNQYVIATSGMEEFPFRIEESVCQLTVRNKQLTIIDDIGTYKETCHLEAAKGKVKYYAGFPLINGEGVAIGSLCVMDVKSMSLNSSQVKILELVAKGIVDKLENRRGMIKLIKDINKNFKPAACADFNCLNAELAHLQSEVIATKGVLELEQEKIRLSNKNLSQFAHRIAHDIKAPLRSIHAFTQLLKRKRGKETQDKDEEYYQYISSSIDELNRMIDNLLNIAEFKTNVSPKTISISEIIDKIEILLFETLKTNGVELIKPTIDVKVFGYETLLKQLFQNIIANGIKYSDHEKASFVKVSFELLESSVLVSISDNGIGISSKDLKMIFEPFKRVSGNDEVEGLGIGLDTCRMIVKDMGNELKVTSELGIGTSFSFEIPLK